MMFTAFAPKAASINIAIMIAVFFMTNKYKNKN